MASYVKFELEDGTIVYMEATDVPRGSSGFPLTTRADNPTEQTSVSFETSIQSVRKMAAVMVQEMRSGFTQPPDEVQMNFGLKASAEVGGLVVARGGAESNYNVMLRWSTKNKDKDKDKKDEKDEKETAAEEKSETADKEEK
jgi:hypothetical protein